VAKTKFIYHGKETGRWSCRSPNFIHIDKGDKVFFERPPPNTKFIPIDFAEAEKRVIAWHFFSGDTSEKRIRR